MAPMLRVTREGHALGGNYPRYATGGSAQCDKLPGVLPGATVLSLCKIQKIFRSDRAIVAVKFVLTCV